MDALVEFRNVSIAFSGRTVLDRVGFEVARGQDIVLFGESGSGKSVLVRLLLGLCLPDEGEVVVCGRTTRWAHERDELRSFLSQFSVMFQHDALLDTLTVRENLRLAIRDSAELSCIADLLKEVGLDRHVSSSLPQELSGGMRRRVALARALAQDRPLLVLDEPLANLDAKSAHLIKTTIQARRHKPGVSTIVVTHDPEFARQAADEILMLDRHTRKIKRIEPMKLLAGVSVSSGLPYRNDGDPAQKTVTTGSARPNLDSLVRGLETLGELAANLSRSLTFRPTRRPFRTRLSDGLLPTMLFMIGLGLVLGFGLSWQTSVGLSLSGFEQYVPAVTATAVFRNLGTLVAGLALCAWTCSRLASEIGSMKFTCQIEALQCMGYCPAQFLLSAVLYSLILRFPLEILVCCFSALVGGVQHAALFPAAMDLTPSFYWHQAVEQVNTIAVLSVTTKAIAFAIAVGTVAYQFGLRAKKSASEVGRHTAQAVMVAILILVVLDVGIGILYSPFYGGLQP